MRVAGGMNAAPTVHARRRACTAAPASRASPWSDDGTVIPPVVAVPGARGNRFAITPGTIEKTRSFGGRGTRAVRMPGQASVRDASRGRHECRTANGGRHECRPYGYPALRCVHGGTVTGVIGGGGVVGVVGGGRAWSRTAAPGPLEVRTLAGGRLSFRPSARKFTGVRTPSRRSTRAHQADAGVGAALLRAYAAGARVNEYLVERLHPDVWRAKPPAPRMRTIAALVAHLYNCGLVYVRRARPDVDVPPELDRFRVTQAGAVRALAAKRRAVLAAAAPALVHGGRIGHSHQDVVTFLAYYMVHDGHHRGQILIQARLLGHPVSVETMSGMWQWTARSRE